jgi:outer membrane murein-binding lipoprotein Lpp
MSTDWIRIGTLAVQVARLEETVSTCDEQIRAQEEARRIAEEKCARVQEET